VDRLKRRIEAERESETSRREPTPADADQAASGIEGTGHPGVVLMVNPPILGEEVAKLFGAAWGEQAPDSPPALGRCLAWVCAYQDERLVGFVKLAWDGGDHAFVLDTTVHPDHQRRGIGGRLVERAAEVARQSGVEWLHVDFEPRFGHFYVRCGFRPTPAGLMRLGTSRVPPRA
jgi:GNAT superfamily N-acetyltransferase